MEKPPTYIDKDAIDFVLDVEEMKSIMDKATPGDEIILNHGFYDYYYMYHEGFEELSKRLGCSLDIDKNNNLVGKIKP